MRLNHRNRFLSFLIAITTILSASVPVAAQGPLEGKERDNGILKTISGYTNWSTVELNGKLSTDGLPFGIKPSVKIFMQRDKRIMLSVRASLMGEVGRAEVWGDSLIVVNKMKRTYCKDSVKRLLGGFPASLADLQALLLGRIALLGCGELTVLNSPDVTIYPTEEGGFMVVPLDKVQPAGAEYGFVTRPDGKLQGLIVSINPEQDPVTLLYNYPLAGGYDLDATFTAGKSIIQAVLEFNAPKWGATPFERFIPGSNYTRLGVNQFFKSF